jgi:dGTPase
LNISGWNLDTEAAFAIGLGHDLGHAPFGHDGEYILSQKLGKNQAFMHELNSYRVVEHLSNKGLGLNLTYIVKDGIISHNGEKFEQYLKPDGIVKNLDKITNRRILPASYEGCAVRFADKIAYLGRDIEDAMTANFISENDIPKSVGKFLGTRNSDIISSLVSDIIENSKNKEQIGFSDSIFEIFRELQRFNYKFIYENPKLKAYKKQAVIIINTLFDYLSELFDKFGKDYPKYYEQNLKLDHTFGKFMEEMDDFYKNENNPKIIITDYIAGMTDLYVLDAIKQLTIPAPVF